MAPGRRWRLVGGMRLRPCTVAGMASSWCMDLPSPPPAGIHYPPATRPLAAPPRSVTMCDPKHISKPSGAKPGQVMVRKEAVVVGRPDRSAAAASGEAD